ncbi:MAG: urea transporter [Bacteroidales bacterium]
MAAINSINKNDVSNLFSFEFLKVLLRGSGQVMFQNNAWTGLLFLCGIFWGAYEEGQPLVAWGSVVGLIVSTLTGYLLALPRGDGREGLWGFNGILVGCGFMTFLGSTFLTWFGLIICAALSTFVRTGFNNVMAPWKVNSLTFPFVFTTWFFLMAARVMKGLPPSFMASPHLPGDFSETISLQFGDLVIYWLKGISQVFLINSWVTGIFFLVALFVSNKWAAFWAAFASALSLFFILIFKGPGSDIANGLYGFSAVLTGIALGTVFYQANHRAAFVWCIAGIIITVFIQAAMNVFLTPIGLPTLTGPFCVATWLFLLPLFKFYGEPTQSPDHSNWHTGHKKSISNDSSETK